MLQEIHLKNGYLYAPNFAPIRCAIGKSGLTSSKCEGDLATPIGRFALRHGYFRADKISVPPGELALTPIQQNFGWCDDASHPDYNRFITLPHPARHEQLWRQDDVYDIIIPLGYNDVDIVPGRGSAIFLHLAHADYRGTEGCVAISRADMLALLPQLSSNTMLVI